LFIADYKSTYHAGKPGETRQYGNQQNGTASLVEDGEWRKDDAQKRSETGHWKFRINNL